MTSQLSVQSVHAGYQACTLALQLPSPLSIVGSWCHLLP